MLFPFVENWDTLSHLKGHLILLYLVFIEGIKNKLRSFPIPNII